MATYFKYDDMDRRRAWRASIDQMSWATGAGHTEQTEELAMVGLVKMICIRISSVTGNPTATITFDDAQGNEIYNSGAIADGTNYVYTRTEFLPTADDFVVAGQVTVGVDPSADAGGVAQTLTVNIDIYGI